MLVAFVAGLLLTDYTKIGKVEAGYGILFMIRGSVHPFAWILLRLLVPNFRKIVP
jgi:hypothetical protein